MQSCQLALFRHTSQKKGRGDLIGSITRPKPVEHGYVFSMAVGTIREWLKLVPFFVRGRTVDSGGEGGGLGSFLK